MYDVIIIGSGPAGLAAAIYSERALLKTLLIEKDFMGTGQIAVSECVENYPGLCGISGYDLGEKFREHALRLGAKITEGEAASLKRENGLWTITLKNGDVLNSKTAIYAAGTSYRRLGVKGDDKQRISYCAVCDGAFYRSKTVAVVGGGDTALGDALYLSSIAETVYILHRRNEFRANKTLQKKVFQTKNIIPVMNASLTEILGDINAEGIVYAQNGIRKTLETDGVFCAVGSVPNTGLLNGVCELDKSGYVIAGEDCVTSAEGLFAAGDVRTTPLRQVVTAAADGANAAASAEKYIASIGLRQAVI